MYLNLKGQHLKIYIGIYKPHDNHNPHNRYTHTKRERNPTITLKIVIKSQGKRAKEDRKKKNYNNNPKTINKMAISTYLSIVTLNVNGLNVPIKRHRVAECTQ